jgi:hypothetical protein
MEPKVKKINKTLPLMRHQRMMLLEIYPPTMSLHQQTEIDL